MNSIVDSFQNLTKLQKIILTAILAIIVFGLSSGVSYSAFSKILPAGGLAGLTGPLPGPSTVVKDNPNLPKTEACPLNGSMHTKEARAAWEQRRPLAVMIENHQEARPQSGLSFADIVYEAVAEGGITRFMGVFYCNLDDIQVGPVRSARTYFIDWLSEYDALYAHVGGANCNAQTGSGCANGAKADALGQIIKYRIKDLNQFFIGFPVYWRDYQRLGHPVATEHTMYSTTQKLWDIGAKKGWTAKDENNIAWNANFVEWKFKKDDPSKSPTAGDIHVSFWDNQPAYEVEWLYDSAANSYKRKNGGADHVDLDTNKQLEPKNVVVQFEKESSANDGYPGNVHLLYGTIGSGKALIFQDGNVMSGKWVKSSRISRTKYLDDKGKEVSFNRGQIWIETVPEGSNVTY